MSAELAVAGSFEEPVVSLLIALEDPAPAGVTNGNVKLTAPPRRGEILLLWRQRRIATEHHFDQFSPNKSRSERGPRSPVSSPAGRARRAPIRPGKEKPGNRANRK